MKFRKKQRKKKVAIFVKGFKGVGGRGGGVGVGVYTKMTEIRYFTIYFFYLIYLIYFLLYKNVFFSNIHIMMHNNNEIRCRKNDIKRCTMIMKLDRCGITIKSDRCR